MIVAVERGGGEEERRREGRDYKDADGRWKRKKIIKWERWEGFPQLMAWKL